MFMAIIAIPNFIMKEIFSIELGFSFYLYCLILCFNFGLNFNLS